MRRPPHPLGETIARTLSFLGPSGGTLVIGAVFLWAISLLNEPTEARIAQEPAPEALEAVATIPLEPAPQPDPGQVPAAPSPAAENIPMLSPGAPPAPGWQHHTVGRRETLGTILPKISDDPDAFRLLTTSKLKSHTKIQKGKDIAYKVDDDGTLLELVYKTSPEYYLWFRRENGEMVVTEDPPELAAREVHKSATIERNGSLDTALGAVGVTWGTTEKLVAALETHIDFFKDIHPGDKFELIYDEMLDSYGELRETSRPKAFVAFNRGRHIVGVRDPVGGGYYSPEGVSLQRAFLRAPLRFTRISSRFSLRRLHPVLKKWRAHKGVDYAAKTGTPVRSTGDGVVTFAGRKGGYGKVVFIRHYKIYQTVYGHLNGYAKGIRKGARVAQGQTIGYVGSTGLATGPHLHYEFRVRGKHKDPLSEEVPVQRPPLEGEDLKRFKAHAEPLLARLELYQAEEVALQE